MSDSRQWGGLARAAAAREAKGPNVSEYKPGMVVYARVRNLREETYADGKARPVLVVGPQHNANDRWRLMGFTTKSTFESGGQRMPIIHWNKIPLNGPGYLWSPRLAVVPTDDLLDHIGYMCEADVEQVIWYSTLTADEETALRASARPNP